METLKKILKTIGTAIIAVIVSFIGLIFFRKSKSAKENKADAEKIKQEKKNELQEKTADDIAADSPNADAISSNIRQEQDDFRQRLRDRLRQNF